MPLRIVAVAYSLRRNTMMSKLRTSGLAALVLAMAAGPALAAGAGGGASGAGGAAASGGAAGSGAGLDQSTNNVGNSADQAGVSDMQKTPGMNANKNTGGAQEGNGTGQ
jgi:hypothetical protein